MIKVAEIDVYNNSKILNFKPIRHARPDGVNWDVFQCGFQAKVVDNFAVKEWGEMSKLSEYLGEGM